MLRTLLRAIGARHGQAGGAMRAPLRPQFLRSTEGFLEQAAIALVVDFEMLTFGHRTIEDARAKVCGALRRASC